MGITIAKAADVCTNQHRETQRKLCRPRSGIPHGKGEPWFALSFPKTLPASLEVGPWGWARWWAVHLSSEDVPSLLNFLGNLPFSFCLLCWWCSVGSISSHHLGKEMSEADIHKWWWGRAENERQGGKQRPHLMKRDESWPASVWPREGAY